VVRILEELLDFLKIDREILIEEMSNQIIPIQIPQEFSKTNMEFNQLHPEKEMCVPIKVGLKMDFYTPSGNLLSQSSMLVNCCDLKEATSCLPLVIDSPVGGVWLTQQNKKVNNIHHSQKNSINNKKPTDVEFKKNHFADQILRFMPPFLSYYSNFNVLSKFGDLNLKPKRVFYFDNLSAKWKTNIQNYAEKIYTFDLAKAQQIGNQGYTAMIDPLKFYHLSPLVFFKY